MAGSGLVGELAGSGGVDLLVTGDMGIGNTTPAACLIAAFTGHSAREVTGRGTGIDDATFELKVGVVEEALALHAPDPGDPLGVLAAVGGLEHAALVGVILTGAVYGVPVVLDGVTSDSAALVARALAPSAMDYVVAGHLSAEPGRPDSPGRSSASNPCSTWRCGSAKGPAVCSPSRSCRPPPAPSVRWRSLEDLGVGSVEAE